MQKKHAESGKFSVVLSYAQALDASAREFLAGNAANIPVYDQLNPPGSPCGDGIPDAYLFDHTGKLVQRGHPAALYGLVDRLVQAVPDPVPPGILGNFEPKLLRAEAEALLDPTRPVVPVLEDLGAIAAKGDERAPEAEALVAQVRGWASAEVERLAKASSRHPAHTAFLADQFLARFEGFDRGLEERVEAIRKPLLAMPGVRDYIRALHDLERSRDPSIDARKARQFAQRGKSTLERLADNSKASNQVRKEALERLGE